MRAAFVWPRRPLRCAGRDQCRAAVPPVGSYRRGGGISGDTVELRGVATVRAITWNGRTARATGVAWVSAATNAHEVIDAQSPREPCSHGARRSDSSGHESHSRVRVVGSAPSPGAGIDMDPCATVASGISPSDAQCGAAARSGSCASATADSWTASSGTMNRRSIRTSDKLPAPLDLRGRGKAGAVVRELLTNRCDTSPRVDVCYTVVQFMLRKLPGKAYSPRTTMTSPQRSFGAPGVPGEFRGRPVNSAGAELMVLTRVQGTWKISAIHWSSRTRRP